MPSLALANKNSSSPIFGGFSPMVLNPYLWLDASDTSTITESGGDVSQWSDKSGNARHLAQATAGLKPKTGTNTINSLNAITLDGSDDYLSTTDTGLNGKTEVSFFIVAKNRGLSVADKQIFHTNLTSTDDFKIGLRYDASGFAGGGSNLFKMGISKDTANQILESSTNSVVLDTAQILNFNWNASTGATFYVNNVLNTPTFNDISTGGVIDEQTHLSVGQGFTTCFLGEIAEIILIDRDVSVSERTATTNYLSDKWGI